MLTSVEGIYRNGLIELLEPPADVPSDTPVIVTFIGSGDVDLRAQGIHQTQAAGLRSAFATFSDWNDPEMEIYNNYDAAKSRLEMWRRCAGAVSQL